MDTTSFNFKLSSPGPVSAAFREKGISDFQAALHHIRLLPYGRNADRHDLTTVLTDNCGTCSTKHALLKQLAVEHNASEVVLIMGLFRMNARNTPAVSATLAHAFLDYIPEAHCYLSLNGARVDVTSANAGAGKFVNDLIEETEIKPGQITDFKVSYHRNFLEKWIREHSISYTPDALWAIREQCVKDLADKQKPLS